MDFKEYQEKYYRTKPNYLAVYIANNLEFNSILDLGCCSRNETVYFLKKGKKVYAVDKLLNNQYFSSRVEKKADLVLEEYSFEAYQFPNVDAIISLFALSFCAKDKFNDLWDKIYEVLPKKRIFAGNLFGRNDTFSKMDFANTFSNEEVMELLSKYEIVKFKEQEYDYEDAHRHYYDFVASKKG